MKRTSCVAWRGFFLLLALAPMRAGATLVEALELRDLVSRAEQVAVAQVEELRPRWNADHSAIVTEVTLRVERGLKGVRDGERVTMMREGGEVDGVGMLVLGAARFERGESVVVFLEQRGDAAAARPQAGRTPSSAAGSGAPARWTVGMGQGKMRVAVVGGRRTAIRNFGGLSFLGRPPAGPVARPLDELVQEILQLVQAEGR